MKNHQQLLTLITCLITVSVFGSAVPTEFQTARILASRITDEHKENLKTVLCCKEIQNIWVGSVDECTTESEKEALQKALVAFEDYESGLSALLTQWNNHGYGVYALVDKESSAFIGFAGYHSTVIEVSVGEDGSLTRRVALKHTDPSAKDVELEFYISLLPTYWKDKFGLEIITELLNLASKHLPHFNIITYIKPTNTASLGLTHKLMMLNPKANVEIIKDVLADGEPHTLYRYSQSRLEATPIS